MALAAVLGACQPTDDELAELSAGPQQSCLVEGITESGWLEVAPAAGPRFTVALAAPSWVRLTLTSGAPRAEVRGLHLAFSAEASAFPLHTAAAQDTQSGLVRLGARVDITAATVRDGAVLATAEPLTGFELAGLRLDCATLSLGHGRDEPPDDQPAHDDEEDQDALQMGIATRLPLSIHLSPDDSRAVTVSATRPEDLSLQLGPPAGGWRPVRWQLANARVQGWARSEDVRESDTLYGSGMGSFRCGGAHVSAATTETRTLAPGAIIHDGPGGSPWARVHTALEVEIERPSPGSRFGRILELPDIAEDGHMDHAWVELGP